MDESTNISNKAVLLIYVRHVWDLDLQEQILCTREIPTTTTPEDIFSSVDLYLCSGGLRWNVCVGITTDGAASMTGKNLGVVRRMQHGTMWLHWEALAAKDTVPVLHGTLKDVIQVVNYIKRNAKNTQCFQKLCQDLGSQHVPVLYHVEVSWLSSGKVLSRFYELRAEIAAVLIHSVWLMCLNVFNLKWISWRKASLSFGAALWWASILVLPCILISVSVASQLWSSWRQKTETGWTMTSELLCLL